MYHAFKNFVIPLQFSQHTISVSTALVHPLEWKAMEGPLNTLNMPSWLNLSRCLQASTHSSTSAEPQHRELYLAVNSVLAPGTWIPSRRLSYLKIISCSEKCKMRRQCQDLITQVHRRLFLLQSESNKWLLGLMIWYFRGCFVFTGL